VPPKILEALVKLQGKTYLISSALKCDAHGGYMRAESLRGGQNNLFIFTAPIANRNNLLNPIGNKGI